MPHSALLTNGSLRAPWGESGQRCGTSPGSHSRLTPLCERKAVDVGSEDRAKGPRLQTGSIIAALAEKAVDSARRVTPTPARGLDLKEIALAIGDEQSTTTELLQAIHAPVHRLIACERVQVVCPPQCPRQA